MRIVPYDPDWPQQFEKERRRIAGVLGGLAVRIDHNGSTAVPGLAAKLIIDIQISVREIAPIDSYSDALVRLGYLHLPHPDDPFCPLFFRPPEWPHTHHVHVVQSGRREESRTLAFRDYLREHPSVALQYETLKRSLASEFSEVDASSREVYAQAKGTFIEDVVRRALLAGYPRGITA